MPRHEVHYCPGCRIRIDVGVDLDAPRGVVVTTCPACGRELILQLPGHLMWVRPHPLGDDDGRP